MNYIYAFIIGGALCLPAQLLLDKTKLTNARILTFYVIAGVIFEGFGIYKHLVTFASAGATIPLTGFGYSLAKGVRESIGSDGFLGILKGGFTATSAGIAFTLFIAVILSLICKSKIK